MPRGFRLRAQFEQLAHNNNNNAAIAAESWARSRSARRSAVRKRQTRRRAPIVAPARPPSWAVGTFTAWDPDARSTVILDVVGDGRVFLRNDAAGRQPRQFRDGSVFWRNGSRSWLAREGQESCLATSLRAGTSISGAAEHKVAMVQDSLTSLRWVNR
jgi:hypothetical protein